MSSGGDGAVGSSICCDPNYAPIAYHWFEEYPGQSPIDRFRAVIDTLPLTDDAVDVMIGEFSARMRLAMAGTLRPISHVKGPMDEESRLQIFEIRWSLDFGERDVAEIRAYHVEPARLRRTGGRGSIIIGLHIHLKDVSEGVDVYEEQNRQIRHAAERYFEGKSDTWGLRA